MRILIVVAVALSCVTATLASSRPIAFAQSAPDVRDVLTAAEKYLADADRDPQALFSEERSQQTRNQYATKQEQLALRSNVLMFRDGADPVWFRDVIEVDGAKVVDQPDRLMALVNASTAPAGSPSQVLFTPLQLATESAKRQFGGGFRVVNQPGAALGYLRQGRPDDLAFRSEGMKTLDGTKVVLLSLKGAPGGLAVPFAVGGVQGRFWIDPVTGRVLQTELEFIMMAVYRTKVSVHYGLDKGLNIVVPLQMTDEYENQGVLITGRADYRNFRKVTIDPAAFAIGR